MSLVEKLSNLRREIPGCRAVVFGDIETNTVLRTWASDEMRQEDHDALLVKASTCLGPIASTLHGFVFGQAAESAPLCRAVLLSAANVSLFQRSTESASEVVCISGDTILPIAKARSVLSDMFPSDG